MPSLLPKTTRAITVSSIAVTLLTLWRSTRIRSVVHTALLPCNRLLPAKTAPAVLVFYSVLLCYFASQLLPVLPRTPAELKKSFFSIVRAFLRGRIEAEIAKNIANIKFPASEELPVQDEMRFPAHGLPAAQVLELSEKYFDKLEAKLEGGDSSTSSTSSSSTLLPSGIVYHGANNHAELFTGIFHRWMFSTALFSDVCGGARQMEAEVLKICNDLFSNHGGNGCFTSGGTESILCAMLAYKNYALSERGIATDRANVVCYHTAHPAFDKACEYFGIELRKVPRGNGGREMMMFTAEKAQPWVDGNTICIVASAPSFAHGVVDDIDELGLLARRRGCGLHVDACLGGFCIPFLPEGELESRRIKLSIRRGGGEWTSLSADFHKFGGTPKGGSVVLYRAAELLKHQMFAVSDYPGGIYATPGIMGSRNGCNPVMAWAVLKLLGHEGFQQLALTCVLAADDFRKRVVQIDSLYVVGHSQLSVVAIASDDIDIFELGAALKKKHNIMSINCQFPSCLHFGFTAFHAQEGVVQRMLDAIKAEVKELRDSKRAAAGGATPNSGGGRSVYAISQEIPDREVVNMMSRAYIEKSLK